MTLGGTTLVMGGAREAHGLISHLLKRGRQVIASLPEPGRMIAPLPVPTRIGAFPNKPALETWLEENRVTCVIDASHAFDAEISSLVAGFCRTHKLRYLRVLRPAWVPTQLDHWIPYASVQAAAIDVPETARCFSNTGRASLPDFADFTGEVLFLRQKQPVTDPPPFLFVRFVVGTGPFSQVQEETLFRELRITRLICRNIGGAASMTKLYAARRLGIKVSMVARPKLPVDMLCVETVEEALAWEANP